MSSSKAPAALSHPLVTQVTPPPPVSPSYCLPHESNFKIVKVQGCCEPGNHEVVDHSGRFLFRFSLTSYFSSDRIAHDDYGVPIIYAKQKLWSFADKWSVYRGQKPHGPEDLLFTMSVPSLFRCQTSYNIALRGNKEADFTLSSNFWRNHLKIRYHDIIIAEAKIESHFFRPSELLVTANAGVDRMFVATILVLYQVEASRRQNANSGAGGAGGAGGV